MTDYRVPACEDPEVWSTADVAVALSLLPATEGPMDGLQSVEDNRARAGRALEGVVAYASRDSVITGECIFLAISDMLNDLRHLLDFTRNLESDGYPTTFEELAASDVHYQDEI